jgi:hypothetical protein
MASGWRESAAAMPKTGRSSLAETRKIDIPGLTPPTWQSVLDHEYEAWESAPFKIDTALTSPAVAVAMAVAMITERFLSKE